MENFRDAKSEKKLKSGLMLQNDASDDCSRCTAGGGLSLSLPRRNRFFAVMVLSSRVWARQVDSMWAGVAADTGVTKCTIQSFENKISLQFVFLS